MLQTMFHLTCTWQKIFNKYRVTLQLLSDVPLPLGEFSNQITSLPRLYRRSKLITLKLGLQNVQRVLHAGATYNKQTHGGFCSSEMLFTVAKRHAFFSDQLLGDISACTMLV